MFSGTGVVWSHVEYTGFLTLHDVEVVTRSRQHTEISFVPVEREDPVAGHLPKT